MERIPLSNSAFEGDNNAYLFAEGSETVLIDTGDWMDTTRRQLRSGLREHNVEFSDIDQIFLTHWHPDHTGLAGVIQQESDAIVRIHTNDASLVEGDKSAWQEMHDMQRAYFDEWGMPRNKQEVLLERMAGPGTTDVTPSVTPFADGDIFEFNGHELTVVHTSGHADGLCIFEMDLHDGREIFSGDALLPVYTPNVGGADVRVDHPLEKYLRALQAIADAQYDTAWPGHRDPIDDPTGRAEYIIHHHEERAWKILDALDRLGPCETWIVSDDLFGELQDIHILHGPGESYAHLEHLERAGIVERIGNQYQLAPEISDALAETSTKRWSLEY